MNELAKNLGKLITTFNDKRVISEGEIKEVLAAIVSILADNKKGLEALTSDTKLQLERARDYLSSEHEAVLKAINGDLSKTKDEIAQATKAQNDRAFKKLQSLIAAIRMPKDGKDGTPGQDGKDGRDGIDGKDAVVDEDSIVRSVLSKIKFPKIKAKGKEMLVGGIRFLENLVDVSILPADKRQDLMMQYNTTNNRWESGVAITVSTVAPTNPKVNDIWVDLN